MKRKATEDIFSPKKMKTTISTSEATLQKALDLGCDEQEITKKMSPEELEQIAMVGADRFAEIMLEVRNTVLSTFSIFWLPYSLTEKPVGAASTVYGIPTVSFRPFWRKFEVYNPRKARKARDSKLYPDESYFRPHSLVFY